MSQAKSSGPLLQRHSLNILKEYLDFGSPHNILVCELCDRCYHARKINIPYKSSQGILVQVRESVTLLKTSDGQREVTYLCIFTEVKHVPLAEYCIKKSNEKQI